jgi:hypothetical protein
MNLTHIERFSRIGAVAASGVFAAYDGVLFLWGPGTG